MMDAAELGLSTLRATMFPLASHVHSAKTVLIGDFTTKAITDYIPRHERFVMDMPKSASENIFLGSQVENVVVLVQQDIVQEANEMLKQIKYFDSKKALIVLPGGQPGINPNKQLKVAEITERHPSLTKVVTRHLTNFYRVVK